MTIDELGFIQPIDPDEVSDYNYFANSTINYKMKLKGVMKNKIQKTKTIRNPNNCWICEGWREHHFSYKTPYMSLNDEESYKVKVYLNYEDYVDKTVNELISNFNEEFEIYRMCPPGELLYYYTLNGDIVDNYGKNTFNAMNLYKTNNNYSILENTFNINVSNDESMQGKYRSTANASNMNLTNTRNETDLTKMISSKNLGRVVIEPNLRLFNESYIPKLKYCVPRPQKEKEIIFKPKSQWGFPDSIWEQYYDYPYETETDVIIY